MALAQPRLCLVPPKVRLSDAQCSLYELARLLDVKWHGDGDRSAPCSLDQTCQEPESFTNMKH